MKEKIGEVLSAEVSILTGLERPVQHVLLRRFERVPIVSILTGLERPVQRGRENNPGLRTCFNPHRP